MREAKDLWKKLRDGHRQAVSRRKSSTAKWKYAQQMEFLIPWMTKRVAQTSCVNSPEELDSRQNDGTMEMMDFIILTEKTRRTNTINTPQEQESQQNDGNIECIETLLPCMSNITRQTNCLNTPQEQDSQQNDGDIEIHESDHQGESDSPCVKIERDSPLEKEPKMRVKRSVERDPLNFFQLQAKKSRRQDVDNRANVSSQKTALETFFSSMYRTASILPEHLQIRVQRSVFNAVMEAREEVLIHKNNHPAAGSSARIVNAHIDSSKEDSSNSESEVF